MEYNPNKKEIILNRELSELDKFVIDFVSLLDSYVIVSGYVSILLGRSRATEDVDLLIPKMKEEDFIPLFNLIISKGYECANTSIPKEAYEMLDEHAIRFFKEGKPIPNIEFKFIRDDTGKYAFENKLKVITKTEILCISPLELQIPYKLFLAADGDKDELLIDKDIEDARHLYKIFKEKINKEEMLKFINKFNVQRKMELLE